MAARIPIGLLTNEQKQQIVRDLHLVDKSEQKWSYGSSIKAIDFFVIDSNEILLPYNYACKFFKRPHINQRRKYYQVQPWYFRPEFRLYDYQEEVIQIANEHYQKKGSAFINVFCAFGKTCVASHFCSVFSQTNGLLSLILYPGTVLEDSWLGTLHRHTFAKVHSIQLDDNPEVIPDDVQVIICSDSRLKKIPDYILKRVGHLIIDEADRFCTEGHLGILNIEPLMLTLLTATYERDDGMHIMLDLLSGEERITRISKKPFFVFQYLTGFIPQEVKVGPRGIIYDSLVASLDSIEARNALIFNITLMNLSEKILILTYHVAHAQYMAECLKILVAPYGKTVALLAGSIKRNKTTGYLYVDSDILVGTRSKIGIGFDEKELAQGWYRPVEQGGQRRINFLILASVGLKIEQIAGRVFRSQIPVIVDLVDEFKNTKQHFSVRKRWYESRNGTVIPSQDVYSTVWAIHGPRLIYDYNKRVASFQNVSPPQVSGLTQSDSHTALVKSKYSHLIK